MRSRLVAVVLATIAALVLSSSAFAAVPPAGKLAVIVVFADSVAHRPTQLRTPLETRGRKLGGLLVLLCHEI
jgi:hypothetical protein